MDAPFPVLEASPCCLCVVIVILSLILQTINPPIQQELINFSVSMLVCSAYIIITNTIYLFRFKAPAIVQSLGNSGVERLCSV